MKITKQYLQKIIKEEFNKLLTENLTPEQQAEQAWEFDQDVQKRIKSAREARPDIDDGTLEALKMSYVEAFIAAIGPAVEKLANPHDPRVEEMAKLAATQAMAKQLRSLEGQPSYSQRYGQQQGRATSGMERVKADARARAAQVGPQGQGTVTGRMPR